MRKTLVLLALLLCSCSVGTPGPTVTPPPSIEADEYAVYADMIRLNPINYDLGSVIAVREQTVLAGREFESALEHAPSLPTGLIDSYRSRNAETYTLGRHLDLEQEYVFVSDEEFHEIFSSGGLQRQKLVEKYPDSEAVIFFSRVGFSPKGDLAIVEMGNRCGDLCGAGGLYLLEKKEGAWQVKDQLMAWMS
jgi:hypothetical protein